jgi:hypothetical protein
MTNRQSHAPEKGAKKNGKFPAKPGMLERWRQRRVPKQIAKLLNEAMRSMNGRAMGKFDEAVESFKQLNPEQQGEALKAVEKLLKPNSQYCWDSESKAHSIHVIADFLIKIADSLPKGEGGDPVMDNHMKLLHMLEDITDTMDPDGLEDQYVHVRIACTRALFKLGYPSGEFWQNRVLDPATSGLAIGYMLEMKPTEKPEAHGWYLLEKHLGEIDLAIAMNPSHAKVGFAKFLFDSEKPELIATAFRMACYMREHHAEFLGHVDDYLNEKNRADIEMLEREIPVLEGKLEALQKRKAVVQAMLEGEEGMPVLSDEEKAEAKERLEKGDELLALDRRIAVIQAMLEGEEGVPVLSDEEKKEAKERLEKVKEDAKGHLTRIQDEAGGVQMELLRKKASFSDKKMLWDLAHDFENVRVFSQMLEERERVVNGLNGLLTLWRSDRDYLAPMLGMIYNGLQDDFERAGPEGQINLLLLIGQMETAGVGKPIAQDRLIDVVDNLLDKNDTESHAALRRYIMSIGKAVAMSKSEHRDAFIVNMIKDDDTQNIRSGLEMALFVREVSKALHEAVLQRYESTESEELTVFCKTYLHVSMLKEQLEMADDNKFKAGMKLVGMYSEGALYLHETLEDVSREMADLFRDTENFERASPKEQIQLLLLMRQMEAVGISKPIAQDKLFGVVDNPQNRLIGVVDNLLDTNDDEGKEILREFIMGTGDALALSRSENRDAFIISMIKDDDIQSIRFGLEVALRVPDAPESLHEVVRELHESTESDDVKSATKTYLHVMTLKKQLEMADDIQFRAAMELVNMYARGGAYLHRTLEDVGREMADLFNESNDTEDGQQQKQEATKVIIALAHVGVQTPGFKVNITVSPSAEIPAEVQEAEPQAVADVLDLVSSLEAKDSPLEPGPEPDAQEPDGGEQ